MIADAAAKAKGLIWGDPQPEEVGLKADLKKNWMNYTVLYGSIAVTSVPLGTVAIVYNLCVGILFRVAAVKIGDALVKSGKLQEMKDLFPFNNYTKSVVLAVGASFCAAPLFYGIQLGLADLEGGLGVSFNKRQDVHRLLEMVSNSYMKDFLCTLTTMLIPFFEEYMFRGHLENWFRPDEKKEMTFLSIPLGRGNNAVVEDDSVQTRTISFFKRSVLPALKTSLVYGLIHTTPSQKYSNIASVSYYSALSMVCSVLRHATGGLWAPYILHSIYFKDALKLSFGSEDTQNLARYLSLKYSDFFEQMAKNMSP